MIPLPDFAAARANMVEGQLRPTKIVHRVVLEAMRSIPREAFVPGPDGGPLKALAYLDDDLDLAPAGAERGRVLTRPLTAARFAQAAEPQPGERALVVAAGTGYLAAILARSGMAVTALEEDPVLLAALRANRGLMPGVVPAEGKLAAGLPAGAPYDLIIIEGAVETLPQDFVRQLAPGGRLLTILAPAPGRSVLVRATAQGAALNPVPLMDCFAPKLAAFARAPAFAL